MSVFGIYTRRTTVALALGEWVLLFLLILSALSLQMGIASQSEPSLPVDTLVAVAWSALLVTLMFSMGLYEPKARRSLRTALVRAALVFGLAGLLALALAGSLDDLGPLAVPIALSMVAAVPLVGLFRFATIHVSRRGDFAQRVLVLGAGRKAASLPAALPTDSAARIVGFMAGEACPGRDGAIREPAIEVAEDRMIRPQGALAAVARDLGIQQIVVALDERRGAMPIRELLECRLQGIEVLDHTSYLERETGRVNLQDLYPSWLIFSGGFRYNPLFRFSKRLFDLLVSGSFLILMLPLCLMTALLIKLDSPGPVFYRQERVGLNGRVFNLTKFRSMRTDAEAGGPQWASQNDPRVTRIGAFLRKTRIDEIPQVLNVLRGDMSFVGPRPERPCFVEDLSRSIEYYSDRHRVKPGITGWAQVRAPYGASLEDAREKLTYDLYYMKHQSLMLDFLILLQTVRVVLFQEGAR